MSKILVTGGTGFVGSHLCNVLNGRGHDVTALAINPESSAFPMDEGIECKKGDILRPETLDFSGYDVVIHLVGLSPLFQPKGVTYHQIHVEGTENVVEEVEASGIDHYVHMSALGADITDETGYLGTKGKGERIAKNIDADWYIFRPSVIFGEGGEFLGMIEEVASHSRAFPLPRGPETQFQPVYIGDVSHALADAAEGKVESNQVFEIGGPEVLSLRSIVEKIYSSMNKSPVFLPVPNILANVGSHLAGLLPVVPVGTDQYKSLHKDNVVEGENDIFKFGFSEDDLTTVDEYLNKE